MEPALLDIYRRKILPNIEEPIREIVNALWELPFVVDTNEACCGHIVTTDYLKSDSRYKKIRQGLYWYPHGIRLGVDFSLDDELKEQAEAFRKDLSSIDVDIGLRVSEAVRGYRTLDGKQIKVLHTYYDSTFPDRDLQPPSENVREFVKVTQDKLIDFWEAFARVVSNYNPQVQFSLIKDKNFLKIIDWADLGDYRRYL